MKTLSKNTENLNGVNPGYSDYKRNSTEPTFLDFISSHPIFKSYINYDSTSQSLYKMITEYVDMRENHTLTKITEQYSEDIQRWIVEEFCPIIEKWLTDEFVPNLLEENNIVTSQPIKIPEVNLNIYR